MKYLLLFFFSCLLFSCSQLPNAEPDPIADTNIQNAYFSAHYSIYFLNQNDSVSLERIEQLVSNLLPEFQLVDSFSDETIGNAYQILLSSDPQKDLPPISLEYLKFSSNNLSEAEMELMLVSSHAFSIAFSGSKKNVIENQVQINRVVDSLMSPFHSTVTDGTTYETFNQASWDSKRVSGFNASKKLISTQFTIHFYREGEYCRAVTLGLGKFCLPDISIENIPCGDRGSFGNLINVLSQTWIEDPRIARDSSILVDLEKIKEAAFRQSFSGTILENARKRAVLSLESVEPQEGDAWNTQFKIVFGSSAYSSPQEEQQAVLNQLFGSKDKIEYISHDDEILAASEKAKQEFPRLRKLLNNGLEPGYSILLKAPFETDNNGREWMWIEVTKWTDQEIIGVLQNDPFEIAALSAGAIVSVKEDDIFDYILNLPDGSNEGNETGKIIARNQ